MRHDGAFVLLLVLLVATMMMPHIAAEDDDEEPPPAPNLEDLPEPPKRPNYPGPGVWAKPADGSGIDVGFVPTRLYAQVRHTDTVRLLPRSAAYAEAKTAEELAAAPRLREVLSSKKIQEVYSEEGYEDSGYDHGGYGRKGEQVEDYEKREGANDPVHPRTKSHSRPRHRYRQQYHDNEDDSDGDHDSYTAGSSARERAIAVGGDTTTEKNKSKDDEGRMRHRVTHRQEITYAITRVRDPFVSYKDLPVEFPQASELQPSRVAIPHTFAVGIRKDNPVSFIQKRSDDFVDEEDGDELSESKVSEEVKDYDDLQDDGSLETKQFEILKKDAPLPTIPPPTIATSTIPTNTEQSGPPLWSEEFLKSLPLYLPREDGESSEVVEEIEFLPVRSAAKPALSAKGPTEQEKLWHRIQQTYAIPLVDGRPVQPPRLVKGSGRSVALGSLPPQLLPSPSAEPRGATLLHILPTQTTLSNQTTPPSPIQPKLPTHIETSRQPYVLSKLNLSTQQNRVHQPNVLSQSTLPPQTNILSQAYPSPQIYRSSQTYLSPLVNTSSQGNTSPQVNTSSHANILPQADISLHQNIDFIANSPEPSLSPRSPLPTLLTQPILSTELNGLPSPTRSTLLSIFQGQSSLIQQAYEPQFDSKMLSLFPTAKGEATLTEKAKKNDDTTIADVLKLNPPQQNIYSTLSSLSASAYGVQPTEELRSNEKNRLYLPLQREILRENSHVQNGKLDTLKSNANVRNGKTSGIPLDVDITVIPTYQILPENENIAADPSFSSSQEKNVKIVNDNEKQQLHTNQFKATNNKFTSFLNPTVTSSSEQKIAYPENTKLTEILTGKHTLRTTSEETPLRKEFEKATYLRNKPGGLKEENKNYWIAIPTMNSQVASSSKEAVVRDKPSPLTEDKANKEGDDDHERDLWGFVPQFESKLTFPSLREQLLGDKSGEALSNTFRKQSIQFKSWNIVPSYSGKITNIPDIRKEIEGDKNYEGPRERVPKHQPEISETEQQQQTKVNEHWGITAYIPDKDITTPQTNLPTNNAQDSSNLKNFELVSSEDKVVESIDVVPFFDSNITSSTVKPETNEKITTNANIDVKKAEFDKMQKDDTQMPQLSKIPPSSKPTINPRFLEVHRNKHPNRILHVSSRNTPTTTLKPPDSTSPGSIVTPLPLHQYPGEIFRSSPRQLSSYSSPAVASVSPPPPLTFLPQNTTRNYWTPGLPPLFGATPGSSVKLVPLMTSSGSSTSLLGILPVVHSPRQDGEIDDSATSRSEITPLVVGEPRFDDDNESAPLVMLVPVPLDSALGTALLQLQGMPSMPALAEESADLTPEPYFVYTPEPTRAVLSPPPALTTPSSTSKESLYGAASHDTVRSFWGDTNPWSYPTVLSLQGTKTLEKLSNQYIGILQNKHDSITSESTKISEYSSERSILENSTVSTPKISSGTNDSMFLTSVSSEELDSDDTENVTTTTSSTVLSSTTTSNDNRNINSVSNGNITSNILPNSSRSDSSTFPSPSASGHMRYHMELTRTNRPQQEQIAAQPDTYQVDASPFRPGARRGFMRDGPLRRRRRTRRAARYLSSSEEEAAAGAEAAREEAKADAEVTRDAERWREALRAAELGLDSSEPTHDPKKYPFYEPSKRQEALTRERGNPDSGAVHPPLGALRYALNPAAVPRKAPGNMAFYDSREGVVCPEVSPNLDVVPKRSKDGEWNKQPRVKGPRLSGLGDKIDCLKVKYWGEEPLDNPLFLEEEVAVDPSIAFSDISRGVQQVLGLVPTRLGQIKQNTRASPDIHVSHNAISSSRTDSTQHSNLEAASTMSAAATVPAPVHTPRRRRVRPTTRSRIRPTQRSARSEEGISHQDYQPNGHAVQFRNIKDGYQVVEHTNENEDEHGHGGHTVNQPDPHKEISHRGRNYNQHGDHIVPNYPTYPRKKYNARYSSDENHSNEYVGDNHNGKNESDKITEGYSGSNKPRSEDSDRETFYGAQNTNRFDERGTTQNYEENPGKSNNNEYYQGSQEREKEVNSNPRNDDGVKQKNDYNRDSDEYGKYVREVSSSDRGQSSEHYVDGPEDYSFPSSPSSLINNENKNDNQREQGPRSDTEYITKNRYKDEPRDKFHSSSKQNKFNSHLHNFESSDKPNRDGGQASNKPSDSYSNSPLEPSHSNYDNPQQTHSRDEHKSSFYESDPENDSYERFKLLYQNNFEKPISDIETSLEIKDEVDDNDSKHDNENRKRNKHPPVLGSYLEGDRHRYGLINSEEKTNYTRNSDSSPSVHYNPKYNKPKSYSDRHTSESSESENSSEEPRRENSKYEDISSPWESKNQDGISSEESERRDYKYKQRESNHPTTSDSTEKYLASLTAAGYDSIETHSPVPHVSNQRVRNRGKSPPRSFIGNYPASNRKYDFPYFSPPVDYSIHIQPKSSENKSMSGSNYSIKSIPKSTEENSEESFDASSSSSTTNIKIPNDESSRLEKYQRRKGYKQTEGSPLLRDARYDHEHEERNMRDARKPQSEISERRRKESRSSERPSSNQSSKTNKSPIAYDLFESTESPFSRTWGLASAIGSRNRLWDYITSERPDTIFESYEWPAKRQHEEEMAAKREKELKEREKEEEDKKFDGKEEERESQYRRSGGKGRGTGKEEAKERYDRVEEEESRYAPRDKVSAESRMLEDTVEPTMSASQVIATVVDTQGNPVEIEVAESRVETTVTSRSSRGGSSRRESLRRDKENEDLSRKARNKSTKESTRRDTFQRESRVDSRRGEPRYESSQDNSHDDRSESLRSTRLNESSRKSRYESNRDIRPDSLRTNKQQSQGDTPPEKRNKSRENRHNPPRDNRLHTVADIAEQKHSKRPEDVSSRGRSRSRPQPSSQPPPPPPTDPGPSDNSYVTEDDTDLDTQRPRPFEDDPKAEATTPLLERLKSAASWLTPTQINRVLGGFLTNVETTTEVYEDYVPPPATEIEQSAKEVPREVLKDKQTEVEKQAPREVVRAPAPSPEILRTRTSSKAKSVPSYQNDIVQDRRVPSSRNRSSNRTASRTSGRPLPRTTPRTTTTTVTTTTQPSTTQRTTTTPRTTTFTTTTTVSATPQPVTIITPRSNRIGAQISSLRATHQRVTSVSPTEYSPSSRDAVNSKSRGRTWNRGRSTSTTTTIPPPSPPPPPNPQSRRVAVQTRRVTKEEIFTRTYIPDPEDDDDLEEDHDHDHRHHHDDDDDEDERSRPHEDIPRRYHADPADDTSPSASDSSSSGSPLSYFMDPRTRQGYWAEEDVDHDTAPTASAPVIAPAGPRLGPQKQQRPSRERKRDSIGHRDSERYRESIEGHHSERAHESIGQRNSLAHRDPVVQRDLNGHRDSIGHRESVGNRDSVGHRESVGNRESVGHRDYVGHRNSDGHRDSVGHRNSVGHGDSGRHRNSVGQRDSVGRRDSVAQRGPVGQRDSVRRDYVRNRESGDYVDNREIGHHEHTGHRESAGNLESNEHRDPLSHKSSSVTPTNGEGEIQPRRTSLRRVHPPSPPSLVTRKNSVKLSGEVRRPNRLQLVLDEETEAAGDYISSDGRTRSVADGHAELDGELYALSRLLRTLPADQRTALLRELDTAASKPRSAHAAPQDDDGFFFFLPEDNAPHLQFRQR